MKVLRNQDDGDLFKSFINQNFMSCGFNEDKSKYILKYKNEEGEVNNTSSTELYIESYKYKPMIKTLKIYQLFMLNIKTIY